jgi:outer membrane protein OmpA-like peptidoglycan-associated protein
MQTTFILIPSFPLTSYLDPSPAYHTLRIVPAEYETVTEQVLVKAAYSTLSTSPAVYETIMEQKLSQESGTRIDRQAAQFETANETIQTAAASTKWVKKKADSNCLSADFNDCLVWCLVEVPAQYRTVTKQVRNACATGWTSSGDDCIRTIEVPAQYTTISYQKLVTPAASSKNDVPPKYTTRTFRKLTSAARTETRQVPAVYTTYSYQKIVKPASTVSVDIAAKYETVSYQKLKSAATTTVVEVPATYRTRNFQPLANDASATIFPCGNSVILENLNFETASAVLRTSSMSEINAIAAQLKADANATAKLIDHTDNQGSDASNSTLSRNRAKSVYDALIDAGISASRLSYEGRGEASPIATNETASGRARNRRTEMVTSGTTGKTDCNTYTTIANQNLATDASAITNDIPARYESVSHQKLVSDAATTSADNAAQYTSRSYKKLASVAATTVTETPAQYNSITKRNLVKAGGFTEWREVVCEADVTPALYRPVQQALNAKGYDL